MEKSAIEETGAFDMHAVWDAVESYDDATDPENRKKPTLGLMDDIQMARALCPDTPMLVRIRSLDNNHNPKETAKELAARVLEAHTLRDAAATAKACAELRSFLLSHRVELTVA